MIGFTFTLLRKITIKMDMALQEMWRECGRASLLQVD